MMMGISSVSTKTYYISFNETLVQDHRAQLLRTIQTGWWLAASGLSVLCFIEAKDSNDFAHPMPHRAPMGGSFSGSFFVGPGLGRHPLRHRTQDKQWICASECYHHIRNQASISLWPGLSRTGTTGYQLQLHPLGSGHSVFTTSHLPRWVKTLD